MSAKADSKGYEDISLSATNIGYWWARFVFAPDPISAFKRLIFSPETYSYGNIDLAVRVISRISLYLCWLGSIYYMIHHPRVVWGVIRQHSYVIKFGIMFSVIYALFNFGASHERLKFTLLLLSIFLFDRIRLATHERTS